MKALITGANGLIGRVAANAFVAAGWSVLGVGNSEKPSDFRHDWLTADLAGRQLDPEVFQDVSAVIHFAAIPAPGIVDDHLLFRNNVCSTFNLLNAAGAAGVHRAVIASSISIYGVVWATTKIDPADVPLTETSELRCADAYALTKEVDEATARMIGRTFGMSIVALRFPNVSSEAVVRERWAQVARDPSVAHKELWAYLTLEDAGRATVLAASAALEGVHVANVVSPQSLAGIDVQAAAKAFFPQSNYSGRPEGSGYSSDVAESLFGFRATSIVPS